ncbi:TPA: EexN family lipoprotein [Pseudomonas aeruginosa]
MKMLPLLVLPAVLVGCGPSPSDTVESLVANPERLKILREKCRLNKNEVGEELCVKVGLATTERFLHGAAAPNDKN